MIFGVPNIGHTETNEVIAALESGWFGNGRSARRKRVESGCTPCHNRTGEKDAAQHEAGSAASGQGGFDVLSECSEGDCVKP